MIRPGRLAGLALGLCLLASLGSCAGRRATGSPDTIPAPEVGVYRGRIQEKGGDSRRFRLLLFAAGPDRIHGEVLSPVGSTVMIVDGGGGELAVTLVKDGVSYVGEARAEILERILGVRLSLEDLVAGLLTGRAGHAGYGVTRSADQQGTLPESIVFRSAEASLGLELKKLRPLRGSPEGLGTGRPPEGTEIRELEELGVEHRVGIREAET